MMNRIKIIVSCWRFLKLIGPAAPFSVWKYSSLFLSVTTIYQIMPVLIRHKILGGGGFQFIWFHSWNRIMNRLFASLPVPNWPRGRRQKAKWWRQKRADRQKIVTKTKRIIRPFASVKKDKKWRRQKMAAQRQSSLEKYYELGPR